MRQFADECALVCSSVPSKCLTLYSRLSYARLRSSVARRIFRAACTKAALLSLVTWAQRGPEE